MNVLRALLFDNLVIKLIALVLAMLVYLNAYSNRPTTMVLSFPIEVHGMPDTLSLAGPPPEAVQAELRGTGKQLIRLRLTEPRLRVSMAGVPAGSFERAVADNDLPLGATSGLTVERLIGPRTLRFELDRRAEKFVPLAARVNGAPAAGTRWNGEVLIVPSTVRISGPARAVDELDSLVLPAVRIDGRRDTVRAQLSPDGVPDRCTAEPALVRVLVPVTRKAP
ncbi:MAG: hypothetical protein ABIS67_15210 [Candidatus Eisenbacteria bacterium]